MTMIFLGLISSILIIKIQKAINLEKEFSVCMSFGTYEIAGLTEEDRASMEILKGSGGRQSLLFLLPLAHLQALFVLVPRDPSTPNASLPLMLQAWSSHDHLSSVSLACSMFSVNTHQLKKLMKDLYCLFLLTCKPSIFSVTDKCYYCADLYVRIRLGEEGRRKGC